ncbi:MAG: FecR domain-containing protein [Gammaproteobacteria bacterium]
MAATLALIALGTFFYLRDAGIGTDVGEQRTLTLADGTRIYLNTDTRVVVRYDEHVRRVELKSGEALFEVAHRPDQPFVVVAGDRTITALGTDVRCAA